MNFDIKDGKVPFVKVKHNNIEFNLILDSGASMSCIDDNIVDLLIHDDTKKATGGTIFGCGEGENSNPAPIYNIPLTLGKSDFVEEFSSIDFSAMSKMIKETFGITVRGLLGNMFFQKHNMILDFNSNEIRYVYKK